MAKHGNIDVPNLQVMKLCQSLCSRNFVKEQFSWSWYYYTLTDEGIEYLREYLHLPADVVPLTLKKQAARPARAADGFGGDRAEGGYGGKGKDMGPDGNFKPSYGGGEGGGFGRGGREGGYRREGGGF